MIKVAIVGGAGYTAGELIRLLVNHPQAELILCIVLQMQETIFIRFIRIY